MPKNQRADLPRQRGDAVVISTPEDLARVLKCSIRDLSTEYVEIEHRNWAEEGTTGRRFIDRFLPSAREQLCLESRLPYPNQELPPMGARVEAVAVGGKPSPSCRYGVGTVTGHEWDSMFRFWRVHVTYDNPAGGWYGSPILGTSTFPRLVHVIGAAGRPFSSMTPQEIEAHFDGVPSTSLCCATNFLRVSGISAHSEF